MFMKKLFYLITLVVFALTSCDKNELVKQEISQETEQKIDNIISVMKTNSNVASSIKSSIIGQQQRVSADGETPTLDNETQAAVDDFIENPREVLTEIALEEQGAEKIDLLESVYMQEDKEIIMEKLETFVPADSLAMIETLMNQSSNAPLNINSNPYFAKNFTQNSNVVLLNDTKLHIMAGAAACMGAASLVYVFAKWFSFKVKIAAIVVVGISAAVLFGVAKELYDSVSGGGVEWRDFWNTVIGGVGGATVSWAIFAVIKSPTIAGVAIVTAAIIIGVTPLKTLITTVKERG